MRPNASERSRMASYSGLAARAGVEAEGFGFGALLGAEALVVDLERRKDHEGIVAEGQYMAGSRPRPVRSQRCT